jgi:hypothetical protein
MDRVGRHFPFAACAFAESSVDLEAGGEWLARAEAVALSGVVEDASHEDFLARLSAPVPLSLLSGPGWWTEGSPLVQPRRLDLYGLPPLEMAAGMLRDGAPAGAEI